MQELRFVEDVHELDRRDKPLLVRQPRLEPADRPCPLCGKIFASLSKQFCSLHCKNRYFDAIRTGKRLAQLFPTIEDAENDITRIPRCKNCHTFLLTPISIGRSRCRPCYASLLVYKDRSLKAREKAKAQKRKDAFEMFEAPHLNRPPEDMEFVD